jgi:hypothetical protein
LARSLLGVRRRNMLAMDTGWFCLDLRLLSSGQKGAAASAGVPLCCAYVKVSMM